MARIRLRCAACRPCRVSGDCTGAVQSNDRLVTLQTADEGESSAPDEAARAAWLSYRGGRMPDQIARDLGIARQRATQEIAATGSIRRFAREI